MDFLADWLYLIIAIAVVGVLAIAGLVSGLGRRKKPSEGTDVIAPPREETATPPTQVEPDLEPGLEPGPVEVEPSAPTLEKPEGTASRLVRLRQRLSRSQGGLGRGLLALLSRDRLDEDTWEDIEDVLLTADIGVKPTQELVEKLRTRLRVAGNDAGPPREGRSEEHT